MSKYTTTIRNLCDIFGRQEIESWFQDYEITDVLTQEEINVINERGTWNKEKLARKIVDHYYMREIGLETPFLFKHYVKIKMEEIMESKLPLIYSNSIQYDPLINVDYKEIFTRNIKDGIINTGSSISNTNQNSSGLTVSSDTPQGQINKNEILNGDYASSTSAGESTQNTTDTISTSSNENKNTDENYSKHMIGNSGVSATAQKMIEQYRDNIRAIDKEIIEELNTLFMGIW